MDYNNYGDVDLFEECDHRGYIVKKKRKPTETNQKGTTKQPKRPIDATR